MTDLFCEPPAVVQVVVPPAQAVDVVIVTGLKGDTGDLGPTGPPGPAGPTGPAPTSPFTLTAHTALEIPLTITAATSQTADLLDAKNSGGTVRFKVDKGGNVTLGDPAGGNNLIINSGGDPAIQINNAAGVAQMTFENTSQVRPMMAGKGRQGFRYRTDAAQANNTEVFTFSASVSLLTVFGGGGLAIDHRGNQDYGIVPFGSGVGPMVFLADDTTDPSTNPTGGTIVYSSAGVLKARSPSGTITQIAPGPVGSSIEYDLATDISINQTTAQNVLSGTFTPQGSIVRAQLSGTGYDSSSTLHRHFFQITNGTTTKLVCVPQSTTANMAFIVEGAALFTGLTPGTAYTFTVQCWVESGGLFACRAATQPTLELLRLIVSNA